MTQTSLTELPPHDAVRLAHCEDVIRRGLNVYINVGLAIMEIRDGRLYRATHATFEEYVRERLDVSREHAYRLIRAAAVAISLRDHSATDIPHPVREGHVRPLSSLRTPAEQAEAWRRACDQACGELPSRAQVEAAVAEVRRESQPEPETQVHEELPEERQTAVDRDPEEEPRENRGRTEERNPEPSDGLFALVRAHGWPTPLIAYSRSVLLDAMDQAKSGNRNQPLVVCRAEIGEPWFRAVWSYPVLLMDGPDAYVAGYNAMVCLLTDRSTEDRFVNSFGSLGVIALPMRDGLVEMV